MFHANAWGLPYGAALGGLDLILPDRFLDAESLAAPDQPASAPR